MIRILLAWGPATLWAAVLFYLSSRTWPDGPSLLPVNDKVVHGVLYAVFGASLAWVRRHTPSPPRPRTLVGLGLLYALSDEYHQTFVPGRTPDLLDWVADAAGVAAGYAAGSRLMPARRMAGSSTTDLNAGPDR